MEIIKIILSPAITLIVGGLAYLIYRFQKSDNKRDAARLIIQEIRRAEQIITDYKQTGQYLFSKKIIATNSWSKNIHYFVGDLDNDELDKISDLYSTGEYLDSQISNVSKATMDAAIELDKKIADVQANQRQIVIPRPLNPVWKPRLDQVSLKLDLIYHSSIVAKLKKIAKIK